MHRSGADVTLQRRKADGTYRDSTITCLDLLHTPECGNWAGGMDQKCEGKMGCRVHCWHGQNHSRSRRTELSFSQTPPCIGTHVHPTHRIVYFLYHIREILVCLIFFCSWKIPNISASAVGGQPGT